MSDPDNDQAMMSAQPAVPPRRSSGRARQFDCPNCGGVVKVTAAGHTVSVVCQHCSSTLDAANENVRILTEAHEANRPTLIEIGTRGILRGIEWEAIGFMTRKDQGSLFYWDEYLLFNPFHGFRFLVQSDGHWTLARVLKEDLGQSGATENIWFRNKQYRLVSSGQAVVTYVKGEFYWRVAVGETWRTSDYASAPHFLSVERNDDEINLSEGDYLDPEEVRSAFRLISEMPDVFGVAGHQPNRLELHLNRILKVAVAAIVAAIFIQMVMFSIAIHKPVLYLDELISLSDKDKTLTSKEFEIPKTGNLQILSSSPLYNNWLELDLTLVDAKTDDQISTTQAFEYYAGQDSDGSWTEGSTETESILSRIPAGTYRLLVDLDSGVFSNKQDLRLKIELINDVGDITNLLIVLVLLAAYPVIVFVRYLQIEKQRWGDSE